MKPKKIQKKLSLNKTTVTDLNQGAMQGVRGGKRVTYTVLTLHMLAVVQLIVELVIAQRLVILVLLALLIPGRVIFKE